MTERQLQLLGRLLESPAPTKTINETQEAVRAILAEREQHVALLAEVLRIANIARPSSATVALDRLQPRLSAAVLAANGGPACGG